jgi:hypothetical protein
MAEFAVKREKLERRGGFNRRKNSGLGFSRPERSRIERILR